MPVSAPEGATGGQEEGQGEPVAQRRGVPAQLGRPGGIGPLGGIAASTQPSAAASMAARLIRHSPLGACMRPRDSRAVSRP